MVKKIWGMYVVKLWVCLLLVAVVGGLAIWGWLLRPVEATKEVTRVVEKVVKETVVVEKKVEVPKEVTRVVEKVVKETVVVTPVPTLPSLKESVSSLMTATTQVTGTGQITATSVVTQGAWTISYFSGATQDMRNWKFQDPNPKAWSIFPNVTNTVGSKVYPASQGLEYGQDKDFACEGVGCFFVVSAQHYRTWSGDGAIPDLGYQCVSDEGTGCAIMVVNVGTVTSEWEAILKRGFTIRGRYWDGKYLPQAIWAGLSHTAFNMLNLNKDSTNAGANCSSPDGCGKVRVTFIITSGKEVLMRGTTLVSR